jgi:hypothetical protein
MDASKFLRSLPPVYWSEKHPTRYTMQSPESGRRAGIGLIAAESMGAFNLIWNKFNWSNWNHQCNGVANFSLARCALTIDLDGASLADTVVALGPKGFKKYWRANRSRVPAHERRLIDRLLALPIVETQDHLGSTDSGKNHTGLM